MNDAVSSNHARRPGEIRRHRVRLAEAAAVMRSTRIVAYEMTEPGAPCSFVSAKTRGLRSNVDALFQGSVKSSRRQ